ncbi:TRAP transporter small permease subunit [Rhodobacteraceae bacterium 2CG4]|uniref:TRAP transporter small permease protein n=1 Tax=Halovulum marinum TaxID=2662447 RepID=A0A6L5Z2X9_9RHOB|nr:TRAP transporter small permease subunit [Halovulum marinum]MSU90916.1 TRAP transporter small permease subunit [Halovulum marinum]
MAGSASALGAAPGLARRIDRLTQTVALTGFAGLVVVALLTFYDGSARYIGVPRISGFHDYGELVYPIVIASCFPAGLLRQSNVTVRILGKLIGPRGSMALEAFAGLLTLAFFAVLAWQFVALTSNYAEAGRTTRTVEIPLAIWWWIATAIMALCVPVQAYVTWAWARAAWTGEPPALADLKSGDTAEVA